MRKVQVKKLERVVPTAIIMHGLARGGCIRPDRHSLERWATSSHAMTVTSRTVVSSALPSPAGLLPDDDQGRPGRELGAQGL